MDGNEHEKGKRGVWEGKKRKLRQTVWKYKTEIKKQADECKDERWMSQQVPTDEEITAKASEMQGGGNMSKETKDDREREK